MTAVDAATITMYARWEPIDYTITYNLDGGACNGGSCTPTSYNIESATITLPTPAKTGYTFGGWYDNSGLSGINHERIADIKAIRMNIFPQ